MRLPTYEELTAAVGAVVVGATVWARVEPRLVEWAARTESDADDRAVRTIGQLARLVLILFAPVEAVRAALEGAVSKREPRQ